jgi:ubiquitin-protein ligase
MAASIRRKILDIDNLKLKHTEEVIVIEEGDYHIVKTKLNGPVDCVYEGKSWEVEIKMGKEYPFKAPEIRFIDPIFHPNISAKTGTICLDVIKSKWTPIFNLSLVIETLLPQLLQYPNPESALNTLASSLMQTDLEAYNLKVHQLHEYVLSKEPFDLKDFYGI